jgi:hypothetical protein
MPANPERFTFRHLRLPPHYTETEEYKSAPGRGASFKPYTRNRQEHRDLLFKQLEQVQQELATIENRREAMGISGFDGITVIFRSEPDYELKHERLDLRPSGIELLNVREIEGTTYAAVFIPEGKIEIFLKRLELYAEKNKHAPLFANIAEIKKATIDGLWTDDRNLLPSEGEVIWWEVWLRTGKDGYKIHEHFRENAGRAGIRLDKESLFFPDRTVLLALATREQIAESIDLLNCIAELRKAKESPVILLDMPHSEQQEWVENTLQRLHPPGLRDVAVLLLDTGVNREHPLIAPLLQEDDLHAYNTEWVKSDENGHGTGMAGLALYGDLMEKVTSPDDIHITHVLESGKIIRHDGTENAPELYGAVTSQVISMAESQAPTRKRVISLAVAATDDRDRGKPSSWSAAIDKLASGYEEEGDPKRLIILCAGNIESSEMMHYPMQNIVDDGIHDPGQAWNALCIGAYTQKTLIDTTVNPNLRPIANAGNISPSSTTSLIWEKQWPLKPDIVFEGGNWATDGTTAIGGDPDEIRLLTTNHDFTRNYFTITGDTSAATAQVARIAATIQAEYPDFWPETIRALIVHSAEWTPAMLQQWNLDRSRSHNRKSDYENLVRYCGFGVPDVTRALHCAQNSLTLVMESSLQPYKKDKGAPTMRDMNLHTIPWPKETLRDLGHTPIEMRITLSYFIEPNPGERGWKSRHRYQSHGLRFDINLAEETKEQFRQYLNWAAREGEDETNIISQRDGHRWKLGKDHRHKGSIHSDIWQGTAIELAERSYIGIIPVIGWWRQNTRHKKWDRQARYSLVVSISTPAEDVQLYTEIANQIGIAIPA